MKYRVSKPKGFKKFEMSYQLSGDNMLIHCGYEANGDYGVSCAPVCKSDGLAAMILQPGTDFGVTVDFVPENEKEKLLLEKSFFYVHNSDYCGTSIILIPSNFDHNEMITAKLAAGKAKA